MCPPQKHACFNLIIVVLTLLAVMLLYPFLGQGALGGFGILGFLGLGPFFFRKKPGQVVMDERDQLIQQRSLVLAYTVFWLAFIAAGVLAPLYYGAAGGVPTVVVSCAVWVGLMLFLAVQSLATLVQYGRGGLDARTE